MTHICPSVAANKIKAMIQLLPHDLPYKTHSKYELISIKEGHMILIIYNYCY